jgi:hypothetical protein
MSHRRIHAAAAAVLLGTAPVLAAAPPAFAGLPVLAHASIGITFTSTSFSVCYDGRVDDGTGSAGTWLFDVEGARTDGSLIEETAITFADSIGPACYVIPRNGTAAGSFVATLSFATLGSASPNVVPDFVAVAGGVGEWDALGNPSADSFGT